MADSSDTTTEQEAEQNDDVTVEAVESETEEAELDLDAAAEREADVETLRETIEEQQAEIDELQDLLLDLSVRVADDKGMGVCPDCHGPVMKNKRLLRSTIIKCARCGRVFHEK